MSNKERKWENLEIKENLAVCISKCTWEKFLSFAKKFQELEIK